MAQFRGTVQGNRSMASRSGHKSSGLTVTCNGWHSGIKVEAMHLNGKDVFDVYETAGSMSSTKRLIATIIKA